MQDVGDQQGNQNEAADQYYDYENDDIDYRQIISKKKESYRVEIRKKKMNEHLMKSRQKPSQQENDLDVQRTQFNDNEDRLKYVQSLLQKITIWIQSAQNQINEQLIDQLRDAVIYIIETIVQENQSDKSLIAQVLSLGIINVLLPIVELECFKQYIYLTSNTYNLIGSLFYVDSQVLMKYVDQRLINIVLDALVSNENQIIDQGMFMSGNLMSGNKVIKEMFYKENFIDILFQIHKFDKLNVDNHGKEYYDSIKDYIWLIMILLEKNQGKFRDQITVKDYKKLIEISFDLACDNRYYESDDIKTLRQLTVIVLDSVNTKDPLIEYFFELQKQKNVNLVENFIYIMKNCAKFDIITVQNLSRFIFNVMSGPEDICDALLFKGILDTFLILYEHFRDSVVFKSEIAWAVSNVCSSASQIQQVMDHPIFNIFINTFEIQQKEVQREILYTVAYIFMSGNQNQMKRIISSPFMRKYIESMNSDDTRLIIKLLQGLNSLLSSFSQIFTADGENVIMSTLEKNNLSGMLQDLQNHKSETVYNLVVLIIQNHFQYNE